jgi:hypothetical protein
VNGRLRNCDPPKSKALFILPPTSSDHPIGGTRLNDQPVHQEDPHPLEAEYGGGLLGGALALAGQPLASGERVEMVLGRAVTIRFDNLAARYETTIEIAAMNQWL